MEHRLAILFYVRKVNKIKGSLAPIYVRITINNQRIDQSLSRSVDPEKWSPEAGHVKGNTEEVRQLNLYLDVVKAKILKIERELVQDGAVIDFQKFREKWLGTSEKPRMLLEIFQDQNSKMAELARQGKDFAWGTVQRYKTSRDHTAAFLKFKYKVDDIDIKKLNYDFISEYEHWLKTVRGCGHNTTIKYLSNFRKIVNGCVRRGWLVSDPFREFKMTQHLVKREPLTKAELAAISFKKFNADRLNQIRDIFLFSCYTGLAYVDVKRLTRHNIRKGVDDQDWIFTSRQKTNVECSIPILPVAAEILKKYKNHPTCEYSGKLLPVLSNQKMNEYLKEIADVCGISKPLTFHIARHTFATTLTLGNGVPMETVSKILGHKRLQMTEHYAQVQQHKISSDIHILRNIMLGASKPKRKFKRGA